MAIHGNQVCDELRRYGCSLRPRRDAPTAPWLPCCSARVEELVRIWESRRVGKGKLRLILVGIADRDHSVARPHWASHPLPFLDYLRVGLQDALADAGESFATPVCESCDQLVNTLRWIHRIFMPPILVPFSCERFHCNVLFGRSFRNK